jgi:hypothetical protein
LFIGLMSLIILICSGTLDLCSEIASYHLMGSATMYVCSFRDSNFNESLIIG